MGAYGPAARGVAFLRRFQSAEGGFRSRFDMASGEVVPDYLDSSSTSSGGLALLACGQTEDAARAGEFLLRLLDAQPQPERFYFSSWQAGRGVMTTSSETRTRTRYVAASSSASAPKPTPATNSSGWWASR